MQSTVVSKPPSSAGTASLSSGSSAKAGATDPRSADAPQKVEFDADLIVVGCGPAGQAAAFQAAKAGRRVTVIDERGTEGGVCLHTGTIPSKTLREAARRLLLECKGAENVNPGDMHRLWWTVEEVITSEIAHIRDDFSRNGIAFIGGRATLLDPHTVHISIPHLGSDKAPTEHSMRAPAVILATGSKPARLPGIEFDSKVVLTGDEVLSIRELPKTMAIIGGGVIGSEYGSIFAALGVQVTILDRNNRLLSSLDSSLSKEFEREMERRGVTIIHHAEVRSCKAKAEGSSAVISLADGREICVDRVIVCAGRGGATENLGLEENGIQTDTRGNILRENVDSFRTSAPSVLAAGDVLGGFGLASTATIEGHSAAADAIGLREHKVSLPLPKGIYAMPEMAAVGQTEENLLEKGVPYVSAQAKYAETSKGVIRGEQFGFLKLLVHTETRKLLGVHIIGEDAAELIHIGQVLIANKQTVDDLLCYAFNQPTFAETYKRAGFRCWNRLNGSQATLANS